MDEQQLLFPAPSSSSCPSPASFSTAAAGHHHQEHEFFVPANDGALELEGWLGGADWPWQDAEPPPKGAAGVTATWGGGGEDSSDHLSGEPPAAAAAAAPALRRRGRKPAGSRSANVVVPAAAVCHVEAERQRRDKLNRLFCELRAAVPTVSRMDKASVLADATAYIAHLRRRVEQLEAREASKNATTAAAAAAAPTHSFSSSAGETLEVQMVGTDAAALRLTTTTTTAGAAARHAPARFMLALASLDLAVQHACVCLAGGVTVQDAVVEVPAGALRDGRALRAALLHRLQRAAGG